MKQKLYKTTQGKIHYKFHLISISNCSSEQSSKELIIATGPCEYKDTNDTEKHNNEITGKNPARQEQKYTQPHNKSTPY